MPDKIAGSIPKRLALIGISNIVPLPHNTLTLPLEVIPQKMFVTGSLAGVFCILAMGIRKEGETGYTYGVVAKVLPPSSGDDFVGGSPVRLMCLFRCSITDVKRGIDSHKEVSREASWTAIPDEPIDETLWQSEDVQKMIASIKALVSKNAQTIADINKYFKNPYKESETKAQAEKLLSKATRGNISEALDKAAQLFNSYSRGQLQEILQSVIQQISYMRPDLEFNIVLPDRSEALIDFVSEPSVLLRLHALSLLMEDENAVLSEVMEKFTEMSMPIGGGGGAMGPKEIKGRYKEKQERIPDDVKKVIEQEMARLSRMNPQSSEYTVSETYLERLVSFPWGTYTEDTRDLSLVRQVLEEDHWGLPKPKEHIVQFIASRMLNPNKKAPILCFIGPPGVGKTSLGKSIARSLGRKFIRTAVGGMHDEAEIRGHRRTYIGAVPGRIINRLLKAESLNPVFMIDEVDKLNDGGHNGNPADALLEVLDPEQNREFVDNYMEVGVDLSKILFITTANLEDPIPEPLRNRMEIIHFSSYTEDEKIHIANRFLIPKQLKEYGLTPDALREHGYASTKVVLTEDALVEIINEYTVDAGVREPERKIGEVFRKIATRIVERNSSVQPDEEKRDGQDANVWEVRKDNFRFYFEETEKVTEKRTLPEHLSVGVVPVLTVSVHGGAVFFAEATYRKDASKRRIKVTGVDPGNSDRKIGRMIEESADIAWNCLFKKGGLLESHRGILGENIYLHINFPFVGTGKDGPSAGVPLYWALYSLFTGRPIKPYLVATGEITSAMDKILPVGGIKEKILGAVRAGAKEVVIPKANMKDTKEIPEDIKRQIKIIPCESMKESLKIAFPGVDLNAYLE